MLRRTANLGLASSQDKQPFSLNPFFSLSKPDLDQIFFSFFRLSFSSLDFSEKKEKKSLDESRVDTEFARISQGLRECHVCPSQLKILSLPLFRERFLLFLHQALQCPSV